MIIVEGQEDAVYYPFVLDQLVQVDALSSAARAFLKERIFGWGAGGASKIETISMILCDLGFERVVGILDNDQVELVQPLKSTFPDYRFFSIPADDVRTKEPRCNHTGTVGLLDDKRQLRPEFRDQVTTMFSQIESALRGQS